MATPKKNTKSKKTTTPKKEKIVENNEIMEITPEVEISIFKEDENLIKLEEIIEVFDKTEVDETIDYQNLNENAFEESTTESNIEEVMENKNPKPKTPIRIVYSHMGIRYD